VLFEAFSVAVFLQLIENNCIDARQPNRKYFFICVVEVCIFNKKSEQVLPEMPETIKVQFAEWLLKNYVFQMLLYSSPLGTFIFSDRFIFIDKNIYSPVQSTARFCVVCCNWFG